jgi:ABC-type uncharacterized transport system substrate-binding protein
MRRRDVIALLGGGIIWSLAADAQQPARQRRIGILLFADQDRPIIKPCLQELQLLGYVEGKTVAIEYRDAEGNYSRLPGLAAELVRLSPDVIFSFGGEQAPIVKRATASIPIVVVVSNDPVASGLVASLARPGGNVTGVTYVHDQLAGKTIELLKEAVPWVSRVAILWNPNHADAEFRETQRAAPVLQVQLQSLEVRESGDVEGAFQAAKRHRAEALIVVGSRILLLHRQQIGDFSAKNRIILVGTPRWLLESGALLLRVGGQRPDNPAPEQRNELPPPHPITSSARGWTNTHGPSPKADAGCKAWECTRRSLRRVPCQPPRSTHTT